MLPPQPIVNLLVNVIRGEAVACVDRFFERSRRPSILSRSSSESFTHFCFMLRRPVHAFFLAAFETLGFRHGTGGNYNSSCKLKMRRFAGVELGNLLVTHSQDTSSPAE
jgi:hypothetical protein